MSQERHQNVHPDLRRSRNAIRGHSILAAVLLIGMTAVHYTIVAIPGWILVLLLGSIFFGLCGDIVNVAYLQRRSRASRLDRRRDI